MTAERTEDRWPNRLIVVGCAAFIVALTVSAVFDPSIRLLHFFQALIYVVVLLLSARQSAWGYGAGAIIAAFWNWTNLVHTTFIANGLREASRLFQTGQIGRPEQLIAVLAAGAHFLLIGGCVAGYFGIRSRGVLEPLKFWAGGALAIAAFAGMVVLTGRQYVPLLKIVFGL